MKYKISGEINFDEYLQFQRIFVKELGKIIFGKKITIGILFFLILMTIELRRNYSLGYLIGYIIVFGVLFTYILIIFYSKGIYKKSFLKYNLNIGKCDFTINESNIFIKSQTEIANLDESNIKKILFDNDTIYIFPESTFYGIIKKRFFEKEEEFHELVLFIKMNILKKIS